MRWRIAVGCLALGLTLGCNGNDSLGSTALTVGDGGQVALIVMSASTNAAEVDVTVYSDGSANRTIGPPRGSLDGTPAMFPAGSPAVLTFISDLTAVGNVAAIPIGMCGKSVSFGTITTVTDDGRSSGDLQCLENPTTAQTALATGCNTLLGETP